MRLSEAIAMGRVLVDRMEVAALHGCALGMALKAVGGITTIEGYERVRREWPWVMTAQYHCQNCATEDKFKFSGSVIYRAFDQHVMTDKTMTLDQLIDWVRSVEPEEPAVEALAPMTSFEEAQFVIANDNA